MSNSDLGELFSLYLSPSSVKEFISCPRAFLFRKVHHLSLIPQIETYQNIIGQERVDDFTFGFFSNLKNLLNETTLPKKRSDIDYLLKTKFFTYLESYTRTEDQIYRELDEKVFTLLSWLVQYLWEKKGPYKNIMINMITRNNSQLSFFLPIMVNQNIRAPNLNLQGRPSALFVHANDSALILIQTFRLEYPHMQGLVTLQASIYARILKTMGIKVQDFLYVNYRTMTLIFREFLPVNFKDLEEFLNNFQVAIEEENFDPPRTPPCKTCEFELICTS